MDGTPEQRRVLAVAALSTVLVLLAFVTPLATGVRTVAGLGAGPAGLTWTLSAMSVGLAVSLLTAGVLADGVGHRRVFAVGLAVLGAASAVAAPTRRSGRRGAARRGVGRGRGAGRRPRVDRPGVRRGPRSVACDGDLGCRGGGGHRLGRDRGGGAGPRASSRVVPGTRSTAVTRWLAPASRNDRNPKQQPSSTTSGPIASAAARSWTGAMPAFVPPGSPPVAKAARVLR